MKTYYFVYDLETGGLSAKENPIIEIGYAILDDNLVEIERAQYLVQPYGKVEPKALEVSGLTIPQISKGITKKELYDVLVQVFDKYKGGLILTGHNIVGFDNKFVEFLFDAYGDDLYKRVSRANMDTLLMSRLINKGLSSHKLGLVCAHYGIPVSNAHRSLGDVEMTIKVLKNLIAKNKVKGIEEVRIQI